MTESKKGHNFAIQGLTKKKKIRVRFMSHFNGLGALKAVLIIGADYRKIDNTLYRYCTGRVTRTCIPTPMIRSRLTQ